MRPKLSTERGHARPVDASAPAEVPEGWARCDCGRVCKVLKSGRLKMHRTPKGDECSGTVGHGEPVPVFEEVPEVMFGDLTLDQVQRLPEPSTRADAHYSATKGQCRECGKWLPGERTLCGACSVRLGR